MGLLEKFDTRFYTLFRRAWGESDDRLLRLFCCACIRRLWQSLDSEGRDVLLAIESGVDLDSHFSPAKLLSIRDIYDDNSLRGESQIAAKMAVFSCYGLLQETDMDMESRSLTITTSCAYSGSDYELEREAQCHFFEDIFGLEGRLPSVSMSHFDSNIVDLAKVAYGNCKIDTGEIPATSLKALGDAIQKCECADASIVSHCHSDCSHIKGCWVLDLILGKR